MATNPYSQQSASGYNASPPPDDGSQVEANKSKWADVKTKLADPVKVLADNIDDAVFAMGAKLINTDADENNAMAGSLAFTSSELTIATGAVTAARSHHTIDTESDAATDDLDTINTGSVSDGALLVIRAAHTDRTVVVKHGTGNLFLFDNADYSLDDDEKSIVLQRRGANWHELTRDTGLTNNLVQRVYAEDGAVATGTGTIAIDDTIPQNTEGDEYITATITPTSATNRIRIIANIHIANSVQAQRVVALFKDTEAGARAAIVVTGAGANIASPAVIHYEMVSGGTSAITFKIRAGAPSGTTTFNGQSGARLFGGVYLSSIILEEIVP